MKLVFDRNYPAPNQEEYQRLFDFIQVREKLTDIDATVTLKTVTPDNLMLAKDRINILFQLVRGAAGGTRSVDDGRSSVMFVDDLAPDHLATFAHEMIHASDHAHGHLKDAPDRVGSIWFGEYVDLPYAERPWEIRAYAEAPKIMKEYSQWLRETDTVSVLSSTPNLGWPSSPNTLSPLNMPLRRQSGNSGQDTLW